jgi:hypothetical protein
VDPSKFVKSYILRAVVPGNSAEKKTDEWLEIEERDAGNLEKVVEAARQNCVSFVPSPST